MDAEALSVGALPVGALPVEQPAGQSAEQPAGQSAEQSDDQMPHLEASLDETRDDFARRRGELKRAFEEQEAVLATRKAQLKIQHDYWCTMFESQERRLWIQYQEQVADLSSLEAEGLRDRHRRVVKRGRVGEDLVGALSKKHAELTRSVAELGLSVKDFQRASLGIDESQGRGSDKAL